MKFFTDYVWVKGKPQGLGVITEEPAQNAIIYKIIKDPYGKRISLERFQGGNFLDCSYDSSLFDFRIFCSKFESSWQRIDTGSFSLIRDHDDRTIAQEFYKCQEGLCLECHIHYPGGPLVAKQKMIYEDKCLKAIVLYDALGSPAGLKILAPDNSGAFLFESWDMSCPVTQEKLLLLLKTSS